MRADILRKKILNSKYGFVATPKELIAILGRDAASIYCELIAKMQYYQEKGMATDEIYCTYDDLFISTGIGKTAQQTAIKKLEENGLITTLLKGMPRKRYIKILNNEDIINNLIILGQQKIEQMINESKEESQILREKLAESIENFQLARIGEQVSTNQPTCWHESENLLARIGEQVSTNQPTCWHESAVNNNIYNNIYNNKEIIKEINNNNINNKLINNVIYNTENDINNSKEESNYVLDTKEKNINNYSLVIQKDMIIDYYFEKYNDTYNKLHDKIDKEKIYSKIDNFSLSYNIDSGTWIKLIDYHFSLSNIETNGSIDDFLNDNIIKKYLDSINNDSLVSKEENNNNIPLVLDKYYEDEIEYSGVDSNIKDILQYFVNKYFDCYGCKYSEKEDFYVSDIKKYAKLIYSFSDDFGIEATLDGWKKKIDVFFTLDEYDKTLDTFLQFDVLNHILNSIYYEEYEEYDDVELPF